MLAALQQSDMVDTSKPPPGYHIDFANLAGVYMPRHEKRGHVSEKVERTYQDALAACWQDYEHSKAGNGHDAAPVKVSEPREVVRVIDEHPARTRELLAQYEAENTRLQSRIAELERRAAVAIEVLKGGGDA